MRNYNNFIIGSDGIQYMFNPKIRNETRLRHLPTTKLTELMFDVPRDAQEFYKSFGYIRHDRTGEIITELAPYQIELWNHKGSALVIKSQKIGISTSTSIADFQHTLLPEGRGKDVLIFCQNLRASKELILSLKKKIKASTRYRDFLIEGKTELLFEEEQTKAFQIQIKNPYNPSEPSRIIGLGSSIPSSWSWQKVSRIHMSDVAQMDMADENQDEFFTSVFSRVLITEGDIIIETPPAGQQGYIWRLYDKMQKKLAEHDKTIPKFKLFQFDSSMAVEAGVVTEAKLDEELEVMGPLLFNAKYNCEFISSGNQYFDVSSLQMEIYNTI